MKIKYVYFAYGLLALSISLSLTPVRVMAAEVASSKNENDSALSADGWRQTEPGVYQKVDADGTVSQLAYGTEGALHDFDDLSARYDALNEKSKSGQTSDDGERELENLRTALSGIPARANGTVTPMTAQFGTLCGGKFEYGLDSHFVVGIAGATVVARTAYAPVAFGAPVPPTTINLYVNAKLTPSTGPVINIVHSSTTAVPPPNAIADWVSPDFGDSTGVASGDCTGSSYSYVSLTAPVSVCAGGTAFVSLTKSYPSCVTVP